ncbi:MAG: winged helix-turn-helix transcriptional regulator [Solirubrobacteraceae bacterium]|nr:winged helix-turn-helix transcriptional regulator [Solirubrobacteraceae bacterium]
MTAVTRTLQQILDEQAGALVGRDHELAQLMALVTGERPLVAAVDGIAGVGKSTLVRAFAGRARAAGAAVVQLDGAAIEPTERGWLAALGDVMGEPLASLDAATHLLASATRTVLVVDTFERLLLIDDWLRRAFIPALPDNVRVLVAGREPLSSPWAGSFGDLLVTLPLVNLGRADAEELLRRADVPEADRARVHRLAHGHPLSLRLAASALAARPELTLDQAAVPAVVDELAALYLDGLDPPTRRALDAAAVVRRPTRSVLAAMLGDGDDAWRRIDALPFASTGPDGLVLHDTVREALDAMLRAADPERRRRLRAAAFGQLRDEAVDATPRELWRYTADLLFLVEQPAVREGFFPSGAAQFAVEQASAADIPAVLEITEHHDGPETAALIARWWDAVPQGFRVARDRSGDVAAYSLIAEPAAVGARLLDADPVAAPWREHLRRSGLGREHRVLFNRRMLLRDSGEDPGPATAALWIDAKRQYMELRPHLRHVYLTLRDTSIYTEQLIPLGFRQLTSSPALLDGHPFHACVLDFGPRSVDGWLAWLVAVELELDAGPQLDLAARELRAGEDRVALTQLECDLLAYLHDRAGHAVPRAELLREVWGHQVSGDGNVIEAAVSALRRKLGEHADVVETVRGVGYRWPGG